MTEMEKLQNLISQLEVIEDSHNAEHNPVVENLQTIARELLNHFNIKIGSYTILPLLLEAYYHHPGKFEDDDVHAANPSDSNTNILARGRQKNHFGELYIHYGANDGLDIVLSQKDGYYLSFLIKNALVNGKWAAQRGITEIVCGTCKYAEACEKGRKCHYYNKPVLIPKDDCKQVQTIVFTKRKGLKNSKAKYLMAALPIEAIRNYPFTCGESKTAIVTTYIKDQLAKNPDAETLQFLKQLASGLIAWKQFES